MTGHTKRFRDARSELATRAARYRSTLSMLPAVVPLCTTVPTPPPSQSIYRAPRDPRTDVLVIDKLFSGRVLVTTVEPAPNGGWVFAMRDFEKTQLYEGSAKRAVLIPLRNLPDVADALCEALDRAAQLYGLDIEREPSDEGFYARAER